MSGVRGWVAEERSGQIAGVDLVAFGHHGGVADGILQFADVAGPGVALEEEARAGGYTTNLLAELLREFRDEVLDEERQVLFAFGEGGDRDFDHGEAVVEVLAKELVGDRLAQVAVRRGDDADVDLACLEGADALDLLVLQGAQELGLSGDGHVADLVEEERAFAGGFEEAGLVAVGAGEGAADVAEELGFEERLNHGRAVEDNVLAFDAAAGMEGAGDEVFAGAGCALDERGAIVRGDAADAGEHLGHARAGADDALEFGFGAELLALAGVLDEAADAFAQDGEADGFFQIVGGAVADGLDGGFRGVVRRHEDDVGGGGDFHDAVEHIEAGHLGHDEVGEDQLRTVQTDEIESFARAGGRVDDDAVLGERGGEQLEAAGVIVEDDDGNVHRTGNGLQVTGYSRRAASTEGGRLTGGEESVHPGGRAAAVCGAVLRDGDDLGAFSAGAARERDAVEDDGSVSDGGWAGGGVAGHHDGAVRAGGPALGGAKDPAARRAAERFGSGPARQIE